MGAQFNGVLAVEGQEANGVVFALGALRWPDSVPLFLGFDGQRIGRVEQIERAPDGEIRGQVILEVSASEGEGSPFDIDDDGIVGFGLAVHVDVDDRADDGAYTGGRITAVAATAKPAFRDARATRAGQLCSRSAAAVWKYELEVEDEQFVEMPPGSDLLYVGSQDQRRPSRVVLWARVLPCDPAEFVKRRILILGTGFPVTDEPYVGTVLVLDGALVWHVFDGGEA